MKRLLPLAIALLIAVAGSPGDAADVKTEPPAASAPAAAGQPAAEKIDINSAALDELATLYGIGEVRAKAIVKGRPYKGKDELVRRKIVPRSVYDRIKDRIIAKQK